MSYSRTNNAPDFSRLQSSGIDNDLESDTDYGDAFSAKKRIWFVLKKLFFEWSFVFIVAGLGAGIGALIGTFAFPFIGTGIGAAIGGGISFAASTLVIGIYNRLKENNYPKWYGAALTTSVFLTVFTVLGALLGTFIFPGLGTAFGAMLGAGFGFSINVSLLALIESFRVKPKLLLSIKNNIFSPFISAFGAATAGAIAGALLGTFMFPVIGTTLGGIVGALIGGGVPPFIIMSKDFIKVGFFYLKKLIIERTLFDSKSTLEIPQQQKLTTGEQLWSWIKRPLIETVSLLSTAGIGAAIGALIGSFLLPVIGTGICAAIGAAIGSGISIAGAGTIRLFADTIISRLYGTLLTTSVTIGGGIAAGALIGTFLLPGLGTGLGAGLGAVLGLSLNISLMASAHAFFSKILARHLTPVFAVFGGGSASAVIGGVLGSFVFPGIGTFVGVAVGAIIGTSIMSLGIMNGMLLKSCTVSVERLKGNNPYFGILRKGEKSKNEFNSSEEVDNISSYNSIYSDSPRVISDEDTASEGISPFENDQSIRV